LKEIKWSKQVPKPDHKELSNISILAGNEKKNVHAPVKKNTKASGEHYEFKKLFDRFRSLEGKVEKLIEERNHLTKIILNITSKKKTEKWKQTNTMYKKI
jgi:hypothetical protein